MHALADEVAGVRRRAPRSPARVLDGKWLARAVLPSGELYGDDRLHLEPQPWAILAGVLDDAQSDTVLGEIDAQLREGSPLGARLLAQGDGPQPLGESTQGGVWLSITHTLIWAAAQRDRGLAWDEFVRNTLHNHTQTYPDVWVGAWSGPDAYNSDWSSRPGWTWDLPALNVFGQVWPVQNVHAHSQPLLSFLRLAGVETTQTGLRIAPMLPFDEFAIESPNFALRYEAVAVSGRVSAAGDEITLEVALPRAIADRELRVTSSASSTDHSVASGVVVLTMRGIAGTCDWRIDVA